jgi:hypothetical protein
MDHSSTNNGKKPPYSHIRTFRAMATALLMAAPGIKIRSIEGDAPKITEYAELPTDLHSVNKYLDSPKINSKFVYHARIYINCPKPFFLIMKNKSLTQWLQTQSIFLNVNNLPQLMAANVGIFFSRIPEFH